MGRIKNWLGNKFGAKSYSVQLIVGDEGFMVAQSFTGGSLYTVLTQAVWTYICASRISQDIASFPAVVQTRKAGTNRWVTDPDHDLNAVLERPYGTSAYAPRWNWMQSVSAGTLRQELSGNQFYQIQSAPGRLLALGLFLVELRANEIRPSGLFDSYTVPRTGKTISAAEVVNVMHANPSSWWSGVSPTVANEQATRVDYAASRRTRYDMETRIQPGVVFKVEALFSMQKERREFVETWLAEQFTGATKQGKSLVVGSDVTIEGAPVHAVDDIPEHARNARDAIIASFDISPPMVGVVDKIKYANLDKASQLQFSNCIGPRLLNLYGTINSQAIWPIYGNRVRIWYDMVQSALGMAALAERGNVASIYQRLGWPAKQLNDRFALEMDEFDGWDKPNMSAVIAGRVPGEGSGDPVPDDEDST